MSLTEALCLACKVIRGETLDKNSLRVSKKRPHLGKYVKNVNIALELGCGETIMDYTMHCTMDVGA